MDSKRLGDISIGDFVTAYGTGYWQLIDIKPKIAFDDYNGGDIQWKKGDCLGDWVILKKVFTDKMKPRIYYDYEDSRWLKPVSKDMLDVINKYFDEHPDYKKRFDTAKVKLLPTVTNIWLDLPVEKEKEFREVLETLPSVYTMDEFWNIAREYKNFVSKPPASYLLNLSSYPWDLNDNFDMQYFSWDLIKG